MFGGEGCRSVLSPNIDYFFSVSEFELPQTFTGQVLLFDHEPCNSVGIDLGVVNWLVASKMRALTSKSELLRILRCSTLWDRDNNIVTVSLLDIFYKYERVF